MKEMQTRAYVTILLRHPMLGVDHCICGNEVVTGAVIARSAISGND